MPFQPSSADSAPLSTTAQTSRSCATLFDIPVAAQTLEQVLTRVHRTIVDDVHLHVGVVNAAKIVNMQYDQLLREDVLSSDIILADGSSVVLASRLLGQPLPERVTGIDLMFGILRQGQAHGYRVYCLGATEEVSARVADCIATDFPGVVLAGRRNGYFSDAEAGQVAEDIARSGAHVLFVAMTSPKKEQFMARWKGHMGVPVVHGVGGSFDVMAGKVARAPALWQRWGLEWLYRVKQEPRRLWRRYLVTNSAFCWMLLKAWWLGPGNKQLKS